MKTSPRILPYESTPPTGYAGFTCEMRAKASLAGLRWCPEVDTTGRALPGQVWDLRKLNKCTERVAAQLKNFCAENDARERAREEGWPPATMLQGDTLPMVAREFICAFAVWRAGEIKSAKVVRHQLKILRELFTVIDKAPWNLDSSDLDRYAALSPRKDVIDTLVSLTRLLNERRLAAFGPLIPPQDQKPHPFPPLNALGERKGGEKLPEAKAFYELVRICFQEVARSHVDQLRFLTVQLLVLTGLRPGEILLLPRTCLEWEEHIDAITGSPADKIDGIGRTLWLRYFAEKDRESRNGLLVERRIPIADSLASAVEQAVKKAISATERLEKIVRARLQSPGASLKEDTYHVLGGGILHVHDFLFLQPNRCRKHLPELLSPNLECHVLGYSTFILGFSSTRPRVPNLFRRYGLTEEARALKLQPYSLRHLMHTELLQQGLSDMNVALAFNKRGVESIDAYGHQTLRDELRSVSLPPSARAVISPDSPEELVAKMVVAGRAEKSLIHRTFVQIQKEHGDDAAFRYLSAASGGFHVTPFGFCINSFAMNPCRKHLKCFDDCGSFMASGRKEHVFNLQTLRARLVEAKERAKRSPKASVGRANQISHVEKQIHGIDATLSTSTAQAVFPNGRDLSKPAPDLFK